MNSQEIVHCCLFLEIVTGGVLIRYCPFMGTFLFHDMKVHLSQTRYKVVLKPVQFDKVQNCNGTNGYKIVSQKGMPGATSVCTLLQADALKVNQCRYAGTALFLI